MLSEEALVKLQTYEKGTGTKSRMYIHRDYNYDILQNFQYASDLQFEMILNREFGNEDALNADTNLS